MSENDKKSLIHTAECSKDDNNAKSAMLVLRMYDPTFHFCLDWDGMVINKDSSEWESCTCRVRHIDGL